MPERVSVSRCGNLVGDGVLNTLRACFVGDTNEAPVSAGVLAGVLAGGVGVLAGVSSGVLATVENKSRQGIQIRVLWRDLNGSTAGCLQAHLEPALHRLLLLPALQPAQLPRYTPVGHDRHAGGIAPARVPLCVCVLRENRTEVDGWC